jgi:hypothetical protein
MEDSMAEVRARRKKKVSPFNQSPYREDYVRLIQAGWSSVSLERYAKYRYDEQIPASTFRNHMRRIEKAANTGNRLAVTGKDGAQLAGTEIDVMGVRQQLIMLQIQRLGVDSAHEFQMNKLFASTKEEMKLLAQLLNEAKADQKDYGLLKHRADEDLPEVPQADAGNSPRHASLAQLMGLQAGQDALGVVEALAKVIPISQTG